jgi:tetratricopeptide (TPR) repeat protein
VPQLNPFTFTYNGHTPAELVAMQREAQELDRQGNSEDAENLFREALSGLEHVLSPTHEDTNAVAYQLATFYTRHDRKHDADKVLGRMSENHIARWGLKHKKTMAHVLHVVDLLNSWFRAEDALAFLHRASDVWENPNIRQEKRGLASGRSKDRSGDGQSRFSDVSHLPDETDLASAVDTQLGSARAHVNAKDETIEPILISLIEQCEKSPGILAAKNVRTRCELIELYQKLHREEDRLIALTKAGEFLARIWKSDSEKSKELMEASVDVAKLLIQAGRGADAKEVLRSVEQEAVDSFGPDDDRTIFLLMRIGVMYQSEQNWDEAEPRFEQALAASMTAHGLEDGLTKTLETALENRHYSYLSRESGAFKSILGTSGIVIRPGSFFLGGD